MRGFVTAVITLVLIVAAVCVCSAYSLGVLNKAEDIINSAESPAELIAAADFMQKEKAFLRLTVKESLIDKIIYGAEKAAALWDDDRARAAALHGVLLEIESAKRGFGLNPL